MMRPHLSTGTLMMPKSSFRARRLTALLAVSLLTVSACSSDGGGGIGSGTVEVVQIVTVPNAQTLTNLVPATTRQMLGVPTNSSGNWLDRDVTWSTTNAAAATVSATGLVTAVAGGNTYIRATAGGKTDSVLVAVRYPVGTVTIAPAVVTLRREGTQQLTVTTLDTQGATVTGRTITWSSDTPANVTVSATGLAGAQPAAADASSAIITATANNALDGAANVNGTRTVTVMGDAVVASVNVTGASANGFYGTNAPDLQLTATALSGLGNPIGTAVIVWSSTTAGTATVSGTGLVDFLAVGTTNIRATTETFTGSGVQIQGQRAIEVAQGLNAGANAVATLASAATRFYAIYADSGDAFSVTTDAGTGGDVDMYMWAPGVTGVVFSQNNASGATTATPTTAGLRVCVSGASGNPEACNINPALTGWFRLGLVAWAATGFTPNVTGVTLTYTP